jgi:excinuclease ABC subunit A
MHAPVRPIPTTPGKKMVRWSEDEIVNNIFKKFDGKKISLLAPLVRGRKGHYRELFEEVRKKGFLKVRVDGEIKDLAPKMQVDRYKIHDIELVIDRMKVTKDLRTRISQSVQQSLKMGKDLMFVAFEGNSEKGSLTQYGEVAYSRQLMCEDTGLSYEEPSPNSFSFNSPYGACPTCKGLGQVYTVDINAIIPDHNLSINEGGIAPLGGEREAYIFRQVQTLSRKSKFSLDKPIKDLPPKCSTWCYMERKKN